MKKNLHELSKLSDSLSYIYIEKAIIERDNNSLVIIRENDRVPIPVSCLTVLMLGPGTSITHAAMCVIAENGCLLQWCGEHNVRFYAFGLGESRSSARLLRQIKYHQNEELHFKVVKRLYQLRFPELSLEGMDLRAMRGLEGVRVREIYKILGKRYNVTWYGRNYNLKDATHSDAINQAISVGNSCLYGLCHSAVVSLGYSPAVGFIHTGRVLSFVYDIADLYKTSTVVPAAFKIVGQGSFSDINREMRIACREMFKDKKILKTIAKDIAFLFDDDDEIELDPATELWDGENSEIEGGINYADEDL
jgi:CRISPR-associated protein Cas1